MDYQGLELVPIGNIDWMKEAKCDGMDTDFFFPETHDTRVFANIRSFCSDCPVRFECIDYAVRQGFEDGWFGGLPPRLRRRAHRAMLKEMMNHA
jgi:WhiB family redox-sensing transcriptional regulator